MPVARETVTIRHYLDDELTGEQVADRNVHRPGNGEPYIRVSGGRKRLTSDQPPVVEYRGRTVAPVNLREELARVARQAADSGRGLRVVGLFDTPPGQQPLP